VAERARYDGVSEWYDRELVDTPVGEVARGVAARLLGCPCGRLLDVGCGTGLHTAAFAAAGWDVIGVDVSADQLRLARERGVEAVLADAAALPVDDASFDAAVSMWTHTDVDDFAAVLGEVARVLRPGAPFAYLGAHPCFVGPHSRFERAEGVPQLHQGYWQTGRYTEAPGVSPTGLRAKVGAVHLPLGALLQSFLDAGFAVERVEEPRLREYPWMLGLRCRR